MNSIDAVARPMLPAVPAAFGVHLPNGFFWTDGGYEYPLMWGLLAIAIFLRGGDRYSLDRSLGLPFRTLPTSHGVAPRRRTGDTP
jgi:hypothetical protein